MKQVGQPPFPKQIVSVLATIDASLAIPLPASVPKSILRRDQSMESVLARSTEYEGGCLCGSIRFRASGTPDFPHTCSCKMCQRHSGALTVAWVEFARENVAWMGPGGAPALWRSSERSSRAFCPVCGSTIGALDDAPVVALVLGSFDASHRKALIPESHSYKGQRPRWWHVQIGDHPKDV